MSCALSMVTTAALHEHCTALSQFRFMFLNTNLHEVFWKTFVTRQVQSFIVMAARPELHTMWCLYWTHTHTKSRFARHQSRPLKYQISEMKSAWEDGQTRRPQSTLFPRILRKCWTLARTFLGRENRVCFNWHDMTSRHSRRCDPLPDLFNELLATWLVCARFLSVSDCWLSTAFFVGWRLMGTTAFMGTELRKAAEKRMVREGGGGRGGRPTV